jgi:rfaE bifunctional protein nucleotidyltransferase chain/domain
MSRLTYQLNKIVSLEEAQRKVAMWQMKGDKVVFTNGCFDILHLGHVTYLAQAASEGTRLVVGLNTDASVKRQGKGDDRPINSEESRALVLAALQVVDLIVFFDQDTPLELIKALQPDVLAKGADYDPEETDLTSKKYIVGSDIMKQKGGKVIAIPLVDGYSTTALIKRVVGSNI